MTDGVIVVGAGLAGVEATWQLVSAGIPVDLYEMKPSEMSPAHKSPDFAELVCSNSFRARNLTNAVGLLKEEMRLLNSLVLKSADIYSVPAGGALAVDRNEYAKYITDKLSKHPLVTIHEQRLNDIPEGVSIIATGPLTDGDMAKSIQAFLGQNYFHFFDAASPIVYADSLDSEVVFRASRYDQGDGAYLNCPMTKEQYIAFREALIKAELAEVKDFENGNVFEGCMPIEVMAHRGIDTMRFGPMKPVGLCDPKTGKEAYAVVQLRQENKEQTLYNMVGFQTHLKWGEQERIFRMIPGMEHAEFARMGVMHRNSYINSPDLLRPTLQTKERNSLFFAGQITGVEGYVESAASGILAGINAARLIAGKDLWVPPKNTALGGLIDYITSYSGKNFQPMNVNFGIIEQLSQKVPKKLKNAMIAERAISSLKLELTKIKRPL